MDKNNIHNMEDLAKTYPEFEGMLKGKGGSKAVMERKPLPTKTIRVSERQQSIIRRSR